MDMVLPEFFLKQDLKIDIRPDMHAKQERIEKMTALKKKLIRNGLPSAELYELGRQYKAEIKALAEGILDKYGFDVTAVAKIKKPRKK